MDDVAVVVVTMTIDEAEVSCNAVIAKVREWIDQPGVSLALHQTAAVLISSTKLVETVTIDLRGHEVISIRAIRYMGVTLDTRLEEELRGSKQEGSERRLTAGLARILLNCRGPE